MNRFNIINVPSLHDETIVKKQVIQESFVDVAILILVTFLFTLFILINFKACAKKLTKRVVESDFVLITGGDE